MVDLHTHILPGMDDGAKNASESLRMLSDAYRQGVRLVVATPHVVIHKQADMDLFLKRRRESALMLAEAAKNSGSAFPELLLGAEVYLDHDINERRNLEALCIGKTPYMLVEFPSTKYNPYWADWLHSLHLKGFHPIVAHMDRYLYADKLLSDFSGLAVTYQLNASRMLSFWGRRFVTKIMEGREPCVFSSDMHNMTSRKCNMKEAFRKAQNKFPKEAALLFSLRAKQMLLKEEM